MDQQANKANEPCDSNAITGFKGGSGELAAKEKDRVMVNGIEHPGVLRELDQNSAVFKVQMCDKNTSGGKWKRRVGSTSKKGRNEGGDDQRQAGIQTVCTGKRGFCLRDEDEDLGMDNQLCKKQKLEGESIIIYHKLMEEASHERPQVDQ